MSSRSLAAGFRSWRAAASDSATKRAKVRLLPACTRKKILLFTCICIAYCSSYSAVPCTKALQLSIGAATLAVARSS